LSAPFGCERSPSTVLVQPSAAQRTIRRCSTQSVARRFSCEICRTTSVIHVASMYAPSIAVQVRPRPPSHRASSQRKTTATITVAITVYPTVNGSRDATSILPGFVKRSAFAITSSSNTRRRYSVPSFLR
jgi:hypothetical protein